MTAVLMLSSAGGALGFHAGALIASSNAPSVPRYRCAPPRAVVSWLDDGDDDAQALLDSFLQQGGSVVDGDWYEWDDDEDSGGGDYETEARAALEESILRDAPALPLAPPGEAARVLRDDGVVRLDGVLSDSTASALRAHVLDDLRRLLASEDTTDKGRLARGGDADRFSSVLAPGAVTATLGEDAEAEEFEEADAQNGENAIGERRWDLRLRLAPPVRQAVRELLGGAVGDALVSVAGDDAELFECAALVAAPGAAPQPLHADTLWCDGGCLFTAFVALQLVRRDMGPTRFLLGTHSDEAAHVAFDESCGDIDGAFAAARLADGRAACGLLDTGEATLYDGRLLHGGSANVCDVCAEATLADGSGGGGIPAGNDERESDTRVLFYVTFRRADAAARELANDEAHSLWHGYRGKFRLGGLRAGREGK